MNKMSYSKELVRNEKSKASNNSVHFNTPKIVDILTSKTGYGGQYSTAQHMWYFKEPQRFPINLNAGFEEYKFWRVDQQREFVPMQTYLMKNEFKKDESKTTIVTNRAALYNLMMKPYPSGSPVWDNFTLSVIKFRGVIFIALFNDEVRNKPNDSYHYKLKQHCFADSPHTSPITDTAIDENKQYLYLYRSQLNDFDLLYTADIGGIISDREIKDIANVEELNNCRFVLTQMCPVRTNSSNLNTNRKALPWWIKAKLCNVNDIYVGFKDKEGYIRKPLGHVLTHELLQKERAEACFQSLLTSLTTIKDTLSDVNCPNTVYEFTFKPMENTMEIHRAKRKSSFLTKELIDHMRKM